MIKPLATLFALGSFATAAGAQTAVASPTSVTLYGLVDLSMQYLRSGNLSPQGGASLTRMSDGTAYGPGSRWGIRVAEDLGGGLTARVVLESGFNADTGASAQGGRLFGRQSYIALGSATAGELRLGRQYDLGDEIVGYSSPYGGVTALNHAGIFTVKAGTVGPFIDAPRIDNTVQYLSPVLNGFQVQASVAPGENTADLYKALKVSYTSGPLNAAAAYELGKALVVPPSGDSNVNKVFTTGANYDFGLLKLFGGFQQGKNLTTGVGTQMGTLTLPGLTGGAATELKAYDIGVSKQVGATNFAANYQRTRYSNASGAAITYARYGVGATYALSKQTSIYGVIALSAGGLKDYVNEKQVYQLGLRKTF